MCGEGMKVVLTCAPDKGERQRLDKILSLLPAETLSSGSILNTSGRTTMKELAAISEASDIFFGVDSAPMHIAAAVKTPVIALFGPSSESMWSPYGKKHIVLAKDMECRPCLKGSCEGIDLRECMAAIKPDDVKAAVRTITGLKSEL
jgi:heptosyltransferase-3